MRVLVVHNRHISSMPSGENRVVEYEIELLRGAGITVETYTRSNDEIESFGVGDTLRLPGRPIRSGRDVRAFERLVQTFKPDVVHAHNLVPLISPWVIRSAKRAQVPVVQSVHNYLHTCVAGTFFRDGHICHDCRDRLPWPGTLHACYRHSAAQSAALGAALVAHRGTWRLVDRFFAVSERIAGHLVRAGMRPGQIEVKVNPVPDPGAATPLGSGFAYVGRLREEKGAHVLLEAWERSGLGASTTLTIAGDGPDRRRVEATASRLHGVTYVGGVAREEALELMRRSAMVVVPSLWEEPAGLATIEAHALGRPVVATTLGATPGYVGASSSWVVEPNAADLARGLVQAASEVGERHVVAARAHYDACFSPTVTMERQLTLYRQLLAHDREPRADGA